MPCDNKIVAQYKIDDSTQNVEGSVESDHEGGYTYRVKGPGIRTSEGTTDDIEKAVRECVGIIITEHAKHKRYGDNPSNITWGHVHGDRATITIDSPNNMSVRITRTEVLAPAVVVVKPQVPGQPIPVLDLTGKTSVTQKTPIVDVRR